jgi:PAS domain S-box-containing protein
MKSASKNPKSKRNKNTQIAYDKTTINFSIINEDLFEIFENSDEETFLISEPPYHEMELAINALNSTNCAVICTDIDCNINFLNHAAEDSTGWLREEAYGKPVNQVFNIINSGTRKPAFNPIGLVVQINKPRIIDPNTILIRHDGSEIEIENSTSSIHNLYGQLSGIVIVFNHKKSLTN